MADASPSAFRDGQPWQPEPDPGAPGAPELPAVTMAISLLHAIAEDPLMRPSYRTAARGYLADIEARDRRR